jgi:hypothetical protein
MSSRYTQQDFDRAAAAANKSRLARLGYRLWETNGLPERLRIWGMRFWNERYRAALRAVSRSEALGDHQDVSAPEPPHSPEEGAG